MRLFIALPIPSFAKKMLAKLQQPIEGLQWQDKAQIHLTLKFLGETPADQARELQARLAEIEHEAFTLHFKGLGYFPQGGKPRVLWAGIKRDKTLSELQRKIEDSCTALGFEPEKRPFKPHVTIARMNDTSRQQIMTFVNEHKQFQIPGVPVNNFILYESKLNPDGAVHNRLKTYTLS